MASINEKLNYINGTKDLIKNKLNDLGSEITSQTTFREYAEKIENLYEEWPKISDTNTNITLNNTKKGKMNIELKGNTQQYTTTGKNILNYNNAFCSYSSQYTLNKQPNKIIATCKRSNENSFAIAWNVTLETNTDYTFSMGDYLIKDTIQNNLQIFIGSLWSSYIASGRINSNGSFTFNSGNATQVAIGILIPSSMGVLSGDIVEVNNAMLEENDEATSYETYTGGIAAPNSDYPQIIQTVSGDNTLNTFGETDITTNIYGGYAQFSNGNIVAQSFPCQYIRTDYINVKSGKAYDSTYTGTGKIQGYVFYNNNNFVSYVLNNKDRIIIPDNVNKMIIDFYNNSNFSALTDIQNLKIKEQNIYSINLGTLELCKIDNNQDYIYKQNNNWYKKPMILKINSYNGEVIETDYKSTTGSLTTGSTIYYINPDSNPNGILITDNTLINQLNTLEQIYSYNEQTNINQINNDLPFIITASALEKNSN